MKQILFINDLGLGGAERVVSRILAHSGLADLELWTTSDIKFYKIPTSINHTIFVNKKNKTKSISCLYALLKLGSESVVQCHLNKSILIAGLAKILGAKFNYQTVHCFAYSSFYKRKGSLGKVHKYFLSAVLKHASLHIFKAKQMVDDFETVFGWRPKNYKVIYNPYNTEEIIQQSLEPFSYKLPEKVNVAIVGRLSESKRPFDVLKVAVALNQSYHFHFIGSGPLFDKINKYVIDNSVGNVTLHGKLENPFSLIKQCDAYLSCSESEGFPNALVEAMIVGILPIHSNCATGPSEIIHDQILNIKPGNFLKGVRGLLFNVADVQGCVSALKYACKNKDLLNENMETSREVFIKSVNQTLIIDQYTKVIKGDSK